MRPSIHTPARIIMASLTCLLASIGLSTSGFAHHSFQATYDMDDMVRIEGTLMQLNFRNPHSSVMVMAPDENGVMRRWGIEWGGASLLMRQGLTRDSFKPGDEVVITGQPGREREDYRMRMETIVRSSDGFGWGTEEGETFD